MATCEQLEQEVLLLRRIVKAQLQSSLLRYGISGDPGQGTEPGRHEE